MERLTSLGAGAALVENARCVRQRVRARGWGLPGQATDLDDSPMDVFRVAVAREAADRVARELIEAGELRTPGHGMLYAQDLVEYSRAEPPAIDPDPDTRPVGMLHDMTLLTCILSMAGSMEQIIAALDDIKAGTAWRKRFVAIEDRPQHIARLTRRHYREIVFTCSEGRADDWVRVAMTAGADGATTSRVRRLGADSAEGAGVARETGVLCVPSAMADSALDALRDFAARSDDSAARIQALDAPAVFTHQRKR